MSREELEKLYEDKASRKPIQDAYRLADALNLNGTPGYVLGDEIIPGYISQEAFESKISNLRSCGSTNC
ncbi:DsbA family protein [uncultured Cohaesibacter sp.]|uniref:DsbA family protein n=1 Tax=uncultured Cohaesibacter sp. TaxID=1002546 RepID=UPI003749E98B